MNNATSESHVLRKHIETSVSVALFQPAPELLRKKDTVLISEGSLTLERTHRGALELHTHSTRKGTGYHKADHMGGASQTAAWAFSENDGWGSFMREIF